MAIIKETSFVNGNIGGYGDYLSNKAKEVEALYEVATFSDLKFNPEKLYIGLINAVYRGDKLELEILGDKETV